MSTVVKTTLSLPAEIKEQLDEAVELLGMLNGDTRSSVVAEAIQDWLVRNEGLLVILRQARGDVIARLEQAAAEQGES